MDRRRAVGAAVKLLGTALVGAWVLRRVDGAAVGAALGALDSQALVAAGAAWSAATALRVGRWVWQARLLGVDAPAAALARAQLGGQLLGLVTPGRLGELGRLAAWPAGQRWAGAGALGVEKAGEAVGLVALGAAGAWAGGRAWAPVLAAVAVGGVAVLLGPVGRWAPAPGPGLRGRVGALAAALAGAPAGARAGLFGLTMGAHLLNLGAAVVVYQSMGPARVARLVEGLPVVTLASALPVSVAGVGVREATAAALFQGEGLSVTAAAVAADLCYLGANVLPAALAWAALRLVAALFHRSPPA